MADLLSETQERYCDAIEALADQRRQVEEDIRFSDPADPQQWDEDEKRKRETDPGGIRPCLVFDQVSQYANNVAGQIEQRPPSIHTVPVGDGADQQAAEEMDGYIRAIEYSSRAQQHYMRAALWQGRVGAGYLIIRPTYTDRAMGYQEPRISSAADPMAVIFDAYSTEIDGSDATDGWLTSTLSAREFKRRWPKADPVSFGDKAGRTVTGDSDSVIVVEAWRKVTNSVNVIFAADQQTQQRIALDEDKFWDRQRSGEVVAMPDSAGRHNYSDKRCQVKWAQLSGAAVLEKEAVYPADYIGIVPVYGYVSIKDGRLTYCGMHRKARNPQRAYNWHMSEMRAYISTAIKAPYIMPESAMNAAYQPLWDRAAVEQRSYLPFKDWDDVNNRPIQAPQRAQMSISLQNHESGAQAAQRDIQASLGMYSANIGAPSQEVSGVAIDSRKAQGESTTANFPGQLESSIGQVGRIVMQAIQTLSDSRREVATMGVDGTPGRLMLDPDAGAFEERKGANAVNPGRGTYGTRVVVGAAYTTQRQQAADAMGQLMKNPVIAPVVAPFWARALDFPHADMLARALAEVAPPAVKAMLQPKDQGPTTQELQAQLEQVKQALQEAVQHAHDAQGEADQAQQKAADKTEADKVAWYKAETDRLKVTGANEAQIQAIVKDLVNEMLTGPEQLPGDPQPGPGAWQQQAMPMQGAPGMQEGPGMDGTPQHEQAEAPQFEQQEGPDPAEGMQQ